MPAVFTYVNDLMRRQDAENSIPGGNRNASKDLRMVTYNIIPLSPASGVSVHGSCSLDLSALKVYVSLRPDES